MNKLHQEILIAIRRGAKGNRKASNLRKGYSGTTHYQFGLTNPQEREIAKDWIKKHPDLSLSYFLDLLDSLYRGESLEERTMAGMLLGYLPNLRKQINPDKLDGWLGYLEGWAEIDSLSQSVFTASEVLASWNSWQKLLKKFAKSGSISKRRASLVLLTRPVRDSYEKCLADLAFTNIKTLTGEKNILITKAVSWLLRDLIKNHRQKVVNFLKESGGVLPAVAVREARNKLLTGKKS